MRRESSTVVVLVGEAQETLLAEVAKFPNVSLARPPDGEADSLEAAVQALRQASRTIAPYVLVPADPLAAVAAHWRAMWDLSQGPHGAEGFEAQAARALAAWRAGRFELPDYYLVLAGTAAGTSGPGTSGPDLYLGPLRAARPRRIAVAVTADGHGQAARVVDALRSLPHGPWWPPLDELVETARHFFAGALAERPPAAHADSPVPATSPPLANHGQ
jgi:hypothetical protein